MRAVLVLAIVLVVAPAARGEQYQAWGDTGWVYASKRECCDAAVAIAQQNSINTCYTTGGRPGSLGMRRGLCQWQWAQDGGGGVLYRCTAEAAVSCR